MKNKAMKKLSHILSCLVFLLMLALSSCTVNLGALVAVHQNEYDWYCEELKITCLNQQFDGAGYAVMEYNGKAYTAEYYMEVNRRFDSTTSEDLGKNYAVIQGFIDYDGNFYIKYSEDTVVFDEQYNEYTWGSTFSQDLLVGDVKNRGSYMLVTLKTDNLYNGEYAGKTIRFDKM